MSGSVQVVVAGLVLLVSTGAMAEIYKCTDAQGKTRYGDRPCAGGSTIITPRPAPVVSEDGARRMDKTQRLLRAYEAEHAQAQSVEAELKAEQEKRKNNCARASNYERGVTQASRVYEIDGAGKRVDLSFEERAATEARARAEIARGCDDE